VADEEEGEGVVTADEENDEGVEEEDVEEGVNGDGRTPEYCGCIKGKRGAPADGKRGGVEGGGSCICSATQTNRKKVTPKKRRRRK